MTVTNVFFDNGRKAWVVEYDKRPDRQSHFADRGRALGHAQACGWTPPPGWESGAGIYGAADVDDSE